MADLEVKEKKTGFFQGVKQEWNKIIWTSKNDVIKETVLVVIISVLLGALISVIDSGAIWAVEKLLNI